MHSSRISLTFIIFIFCCCFLEREVWSDNISKLGDELRDKIIDKAIEKGTEAGKKFIKQIQGNHEDNNGIDSIALEQLRLWAKQLGIPQEQVDQSNAAHLIQMIRKKTNESHIENEKQEIIRIAKIVGISNTQIKNFNTSGLLSEIFIRLDETRKFNQNILNEEDLRILDICLNDDKKVLEKVKKYHDFLEEIHGHKLIVLPDSHSQQQ